VSEIKGRGVVAWWTAMSLPLEPCRLARSTRTPETRGLRHQKGRKHCGTSKQTWDTAFTSFSSSDLPLEALVHTNGQLLVTTPRGSVIKARASGT
jgi:hypothetical protein